MIFLDRNKGGVSGSSTFSFFGLGPLEIMDEIIETAFCETTLVSFGFSSFFSGLLSVDHLPPVDLLDCSDEFTPEAEFSHFDISTDSVFYGRVSANLLQKLNHSHSKLACQDFRLDVPAHFVFGSCPQPLSARPDFDIDFLLNKHLRPDKQVEQERKRRHQVHDVRQGFWQSGKGSERRGRISRGWERRVGAGRDRLGLQQRHQRR